MPEGDTVKLKLRPDERNLLLDIILSEELAEKLRVIIAGQGYVSFTLDELDELVGCVAAEANHTEDRARQRQLDIIADRIEELLDESEGA